MPSFGATEISTIEHLILLDLLGAPNPRIHSFFIDTAWLYDGFVSAEQRLSDTGSFAQDSHTVNNFFVPRQGAQKNSGGIGDDHVPFLKKGVSILHLIAAPFPRVWHTLHVSQLFSATSLMF